MTRPPASRATLPLQTALAENSTLSGLMHRLRESNARYAAIRDLLPAGVAEQVNPGKLDDLGWALVVPSGAAAAKLRHCLPTLEAALGASGWPPVAIRIRVVSRPKP